MLGTAKVDVQLPYESADTILPTVALLRIALIPLSLAAKPDPVTVTWVPALAVERLTLILGVTEKLDVVVPLELPITEMVWLPEAAWGTEKVEVKVVALG